jgi:hypothetical protein
MATSDVVTMGISKLVTNNAIASLVSDQICDRFQEIQRTIL